MHIDATVHAELSSNTAENLGTRLSQPSSEEALLNVERAEAAHQELVQSYQHQTSGCLGSDDALIHTAAAESELAINILGSADFIANGNRSSWPESACLGRLLSGTYLRPACAQTYIHTAAYMEVGRPQEAIALLTNTIERARVLLVRAHGGH